jgi:hypothetical protein
VGNFLVVIPAKGAAESAKSLFRNGLIAAREIRGQVPSHFVETEWAFAASFPRYNGSGGTVVTDPKTGSWILSTGTWFHAEGYASGAESKLLQRYLEVGATRLAQELEGFFVLVFGDARTCEVVVVTDIIGSCHSFQRTFDVGMVLSGSSLLLAALESCKLDLTACQEFFCTGIIYEDRTCHYEVRKLAPATIFHFVEGKKRSSETYWQAADAKPESRGGEEAVEALWDATMRAAKRIHSIYPNPVCDLTGGYDSRALVAAFLGAGVRFTTAVSGSDDSADVRISRGLAQRLGLASLHSEPLKNVSFEQVLPCLPMTDGEYDLVNYAEIREIHKGLSQQFDISINGSFGEVARGYWWELLFPRIGARSPLDAHKVAQRRYAAQRCDSSIFPAAARTDLADHFAGVIERTNAGLTEMPNTFQMDNAYLMMRMQRWQGRIASSTNQMWPCLSPFMFRSVLEIMLSARAMLRWRSLMVRKMLSEFSPRLAEYPLEHGFPAEPTTWGNFYRFFPLATYFGEKVARKIRGKLGMHGKLKDDGDDSRMQLWRQEEVKEFLRPEKMELSHSLDSAALANFLIRSQQPFFEFGEQWARMLSLECALQAIHRVSRTFV